MPCNCHSSQTSYAKLPYSGHLPPRAPVQFTPTPPEFHYYRIAPAPTYWQPIPWWHQQLHPQTQIQQQTGIGYPTPGYVTPTTY